MADDNNDDRPESSIVQSSRYGTNPLGNKDRREPSFGNFDEDGIEEYEEPDRDTDYSSGYVSESVADEDEFEGSFAENNADEPIPPDTLSSVDTEPEYAETRESDDWLELEESFPDDDEEDLSPPESEAPPVRLSSLENELEHTETEEPDDWLEEEEYYEDENRGSSSWPLSMIGVAAAALVLLGVGIYGVMQERAATQTELRDLRATLATSSNQENVGNSREALREMQQAYDTLAAEAKALAVENQILTEAVAGLNAQLRDRTDKPQVQAPSTTTKQPITVSDRKTQSARPAAQPPVAAKPVAPASAVPQPATPVSAEHWFVNFGSYSSRPMAQSWASKIQPVAGNVVVVPGSKDGKTYYRVRVVELPGKGSADRVARQLEKELQVSRLWVGQE